MAAIYADIRAMGSMEDYNAAVAKSRAVLKQAPETREFIRYATLATNSHDTQPWRFKVTERRIDILPDLTRHLTAVYPDNHHLFVSLGCAAENLALAAAILGRGGALSFAGDNVGSVSFSFANEVPAELALFDAIPKRQSTHSLYNGRAVTAADLATLANSATVAGVDDVFSCDRAKMTQVRDLEIAGNSAQMADVAFMRELKSWLRFNPRQALETGDGLFSATTGNPVLPAWAGSLMLDLVFKAAIENYKYPRQIDSSAGIAVFIAQKDDAERWVLVGRACQRFWAAGNGPWS